MKQTTTKRPTIPVSERAILQRINRVLDKDYEIVRKCRTSARDYNYCGDYYRLDYNRNAIINTHVDLEELAKELGVLSYIEFVQS